MKISATESHSILMEVYGDNALAKRRCQKWFARFKIGYFGLEAQELPGEPKQIEEEESAALLEQDSCQTQEKLAESVRLEQTTVSKSLKDMGMIQVMLHWVPLELKERDVERRKIFCEYLHERQKRKGYLHRIVTGDEKWVHYENSKRKKAWVTPSEPGPSQPKRDSHCAKVMLCVFWDMKSMVYYEQ
jgi:histone-lysine N-methyltransferase SETMAR